MENSRFQRLTRAARARQGGAVTLAIGILLLLLITLVTLYGARVTILEQRISGNDYRSREAAGTAQAGLNYGIEYARAYQELIRSTAAGGWLDGTLDLAGDNPEWAAVVDLGDCSSPADAAQQAACDSGFRGPVRYFGTRFDPGNSSTYDVPLDWPASGSGALSDCPGADCRVRVEFILCEYTTAPPGGVCLDAGGTAEQYAVLVLARGESEDRSAQASVRQAMTLFDFIPGNALPPMMAANTVQVQGNLSVVVNPDGAGPGTGIPISGWSGDNLAMSGAASFCYPDEYFQTRAGGAGGSDLTAMPSCNPDLGNQPCVAQVSTDEGLCPLAVCEDCDCPAPVVGGALTYAQNNVYYEGIDVVDVDNDYGPTPDALNFPEDVFNYVFGIPRDDYETLKASLPADHVIDNCAGIDETSSGVYWIEGNCQISATGGSPDGPLIIITEGDFLMQGGGTYFGLVFIFSDPPDIPGGTVGLRGGVEFYGVIVSDHEINMGNGSFDMIYSDCMLKKIVSDDSFKRLGPVPGSWADHL